jgi:DMSO reductase anchor subunit
MSREVIALPAFMASVAGWGLIHLLDWNPVIFTYREIFEVDLSLLAGAVATLLCFVLFLCTAMIYACIKMLQEWATPLTVVNYTLLGGASGFMLATFFAAWQGSGMTLFFGAWALILTVFAFFSRAASLYRNGHLRHKSTLESAIGIRHSQIEQKAQGSMAGSFNTREYFHGASRRKYRSVKWLFLLLVFPLPVLLVSAGLGTNLIGFLAAAFLVQYAGLLLERWFFFAQANHPQNLYYQTV